MKGVTFIRSVPVCDLSQNLDLVTAVFGVSYLPMQLLSNATLAQVALVVDQPIRMNWNTHLILVSDKTHFLAFLPASNDVCIDTYWYSHGLHATINVMAGLPNPCREQQNNLATLRQLSNQLQDIA